MMARPPRRWRHMSAGWNEGPEKEDVETVVFLPAEHTQDNHILESTCVYMVHLCVSNSVASNNGVMESII